MDIRRQYFFYIETAKPAGEGNFSRQNRLAEINQGKAVMGWDANESQLERFTLAAATPGSFK